MLDTDGRREIAARREKKMEREDTMTHPAERLRACPFCGGPARMCDFLCGNDSWEYRIDCAEPLKCTAIATTGYKDTEAEAIKAWNTRAGERE